MNRTDNPMATEKHKIPRTSYPRQTDQERSLKSQSNTTEIIPTPHIVNLLSVQMQTSIRFHRKSKKCKKKSMNLWNLTSN